MGNVNALLTERLNKNEKSSKMSEMATRTASGNRTSFSGIFSIIELNENEKNLIEAILHQYSFGQENIEKDLESLISITSEVKAITNQAAILHGERIKKAQEVLKNYKDGAFTTWLIATYGNRQTPYNFLQYYEFFSAMPKNLHPQIESMPRQAVYTLASREGPLNKKQMIVERYKGETKSEVLSLIREVFPLAESDRRKENIGEATLRQLFRVLTSVKSGWSTINKTQKTEIFELLNEIQQAVEECKIR